MQMSTTYIYSKNYTTVSFIVFFQLIKYNRECKQVTERERERYREIDRNNEIERNKDQESVEKYVQNWFL